MDPRSTKESRNGHFGVSWRPLGTFWKHLGEVLGSVLTVFCRFWMESWSWTSFCTVSIFQESRLEASWDHFLAFGRPFGRNFGGLSCHRLHSKQNMQNRRFTCILCTQGRFFRIFGHSKTLYFTVLVALESHFDCIFTVKS